MKTPLIILIVAALLIAAPVIVLSEERIVAADSVPEAGYSVITVETQPAGALVVVDTLYRGKTPVTLMTLPRPLRITAEMPAFSPVDCTIVPTEGERADFLIRLSPRSTRGAFDGRTFLTAFGISGGVVMVMTLLALLDVY